MYSLIIKPILFRFNPEFIHNQFTNFGELLGSNFLTRDLMGILYRYKPSSISKVVDGIHYKSPVLLSAGFDYDGRLTQILPYIGFGGEEIGSTTAYASDGNPSPQLTRLRENKSVMVNKGLKNEGVNNLIKRLRSRKRLDGFVRGVSIAMTNRAESAEEEVAIQDYCESLVKLEEADVADYYTLNISCPNAFCGENFVTATKLRKLLDAVMKIDFDKPMYIKMPINKKEDEFKAITDTIAQYSRITGVIVGNLNKDYSDLDLREEAPKEYSGGLSGRPTEFLSNKWIKYVKQNYNDRFTIIGVGGIMSPEQAIEKLELGADLIQLITGMIYKGPGLIKSINKEIEKRQHEK